MYIELIRRVQQCLNFTACGKNNTVKNFQDLLIYLLYITDHFRISQHLCSKSNMVLYLTAFPINLSAKALHTLCGLSDFVLPRFRTTSYGKHFGAILVVKLVKTKKDSPGLVFV